MNKPFRMSISDIFSIKGVGTVVSGKVETGIVKPGMNVSLCPGGKNSQGKVISIEAHNEKLE